MQRISLKWLTALLLPALAACTQVPSVSEVAQSRWVEARTDNFVVVTNVSDARARKIVQDLEEFRRFALTALDIESVETALPFTIYAVTGDSQMQALVESAGAFGVFQSSYRGGLAVVNLNARGLDGTESLRVTQTRRGPQFRVSGNLRSIGMDGVFHEYVHYLQALDTKRRYPLWFAEGYAEYLSTLKITPDGRYKVGNAPMHRVEELQRGISDPRTRRSADSRFRWIPYDAILNARGYDTGHGNGPLYAQAWLLTHYLLSKPERTEQLDEFLAALNTPTVDSVPAFEEMFGMSISQLNGRMRQYLRGRRFQATYFDRPAEPLPEPQIAEVAPADIRAQLAYVMIHFTRSLERAEALLQEASQIDPSNELVRALLGSVAFAEGDHARVQQLIQAAGPMADQQAEFLILKGHTAVMEAIALFEKNDPQWQAEIESARRAYVEAIKQDPFTVEPKLALGRSHLLSNSLPPDAVVELVEEAKEQVPASVEAHMVLGHLHLRRGEVDVAQQRFEHVLAWSRSADFRRRARAMLETIQDYLADAGGSEEGVNATP